MSSFNIRAIGTVSSTLKTLDAAPRQADEGAPDAWLVFEPAAVEGLRNIQAGDELILITWLEAIDGTPIVDVKPVLSPDIARR
jgi:tRNA (Thr-GGU) A37 N-methylase